MGLSLPKVGRKIWEVLTPQNEEAQRRSEASLNAGNQKIQQAQGFKYGPLTNPQARQQFLQQNQAPRFNAGRAALGAFADTLTKPEQWNARVNVGNFRGSGLLEDFINSPMEQGQGLVNIGQGNIKKGVGQFVTGTLEGPAGLIPITKTGQAVAKGAGLLPKVTAAAKIGALEGGIGAGLYGAGRAAEQGGSAGDILRGGALGGAIGAAGGAALGAGLPAVTAATRGAVRAADARAASYGVSPQGGYVKKPKVTAKRPYDELQTQIEQAHNAGDKAAEAKLTAQLPDQGMNPNAVLPPERRAELIKNMRGPLPRVESKATPQVKARGFKKNMFTENFYKGNPTAKAVIESIPGYKPITNGKTLAKAAREVGENREATYAYIATKPQLTTADDVARGNLLLREAVESGDIEAAIQLGTKLGVDGTKLGQAVQAYSLWKRTTPEGILRFAGKKADKAGRELSPELGRELVEQAKRIAAMPESLERAKATRELLGKAESAGRNWKSVLGEILNAPRAAMATADFSAPLRQGAVLGSRFPKEFGKNVAESVKYFFRPGVYEQAMYDLTQRPTYALMKSHKLAVSGAEELTGTEEQFMSNILESDFAKKLGVGHVVAASSRAYTGFLTKLRADAFDKILADTKTAGVKLDKPALDALSKFINSASGRGEGALTNKISRLNVLFSPRLWKSRLDTIMPGYYARLDPVARKYALQSAGSFFSIMGTVLGLAALAGADVEADPRSADFAKIRVGNTRYDILGGHQQNIRLLAQQITGEKINSVTGEPETLGPNRGFGKPSRLDLLYQFFENKENPTLAYGTKLLRGTDPVGNPINPATEAVKLFTPLTAQGTYETSKDQGSLVKGAAMNIPGVFGTGVQTYGQEKAPPAKPGTGEVKQGDKKVETADMRKQLEESAGEGYRLQPLPDGKFAYTLDGDTAVHTAKDKESARKAIARDSFKKSDQKKKVIGDTYYYKTKGGDVKSKPKIDYEADQAEAKLNLEMDRAYEAGNLDKWLTSAEQKYNALEQRKSMYDPETEQDSIDKLVLQQENLMQKAEGYMEKGIGKGKGKARLKTAGSVYQYAVPLGTGRAISVPKVAAPRRAKVRSRAKVAVGKPKVTLKKSRV